ncbi:MAG: bifunctional 4-hydroxy-2-oxoglutarate aldolase/2-dehydro-3-deoxy-phosphogluconate aldolase [Spirochaetaceae bacterium]|jgi:2-dehydro-3-deoxyphosphogluconate aldolase/(4S)-4-hydroxy-2-oxoglutarate aldolase|nr:bifunctional 4-hydroxy-2-oxoglutarate aldolase/2-dehydro-3-deoxy-phosphogluconate aldolase [Spirochaetaceae bacterium]
MTVGERIGKTYLVPVVVLDDAAQAVDTARALCAGGVDIVEITLRTAAGLPSIAAVAKNCPDVLAGAGTVLSLDACKKAIDNGAKFIVSPGFDDAIVEYCQKQKIDVFPGCVTPTEITRALNAGLSVVKFFPANVYGGIKAIKALSGPFPHLKFVPTGGVDLGNLADYIAPQIHAVGGGWLCDKKLVNARDWPALTKIAADSRAVVEQHRQG